MKRNSKLALTLIAACLSLAACGKTADKSADNMEGGSGAKSGEKGLPPGGESPSKPPK